MKAFLLGIIFTLLMISVVGFLYVRSKYMPVAATDPPLPFEKQLAHIALDARIARDAPQRDVSGFTTADLLGGELLDRMVKIWLETEFESGRHARRVDKITRFENEASRAINTSPS